MEIFLPQLLDGEDKSCPFINCLRNQYKHLRKWAKRAKTDCFRIYDREISHYPLAIDLYAGRFCIQYFSPTRELNEPEETLIQDVNKKLKQLFGVLEKDIFWRIRAKNKQTRQYEKIDHTQHFFDVIEYGVKFRINLEDYLDTGLFLDHRETRQIVAKASKGKRLLNLFAYTCSFSVHAAVLGACFTKSVDMSNTYTAWGEENFLLNELLLKNNVVIREDCLKFLDQEIKIKEKYDVIVIDPPTISRSKKMTQLFDIQIDYIELINKSLELLSNSGTIYFSTNSRRFKFDESIFSHCGIQEITEKTIPIDYKNKKIHRCWEITK
ncbi:MAG: class I SAM-dependent methyltransferase [Parachlamydiaceae bacterium]|nr:class I SAM-dependent methyltransferase [Parachlamydiaceae bacterium]